MPQPRQAILSKISEVMFAGNRPRILHLEHPRPVQFSIPSEGNRAGYQRFALCAVTATPHSRVVFLPCGIGMVNPLHAIPPRVRVWDRHALGSRGRVNSAGRWASHARSMFAACMALLGSDRPYSSVCAMSS
jgi:hypothetical protein